VRLACTHGVARSDNEMARLAKMFLRFRTIGRAKRAPRSDYAGVWHRQQHTDYR
jgi:hypothetical protein